jgi:DNA-binding winged helix-turn-helix (wHTH) protein
LFQAESGYDEVVPGIVRFGLFEANLATGELRKNGMRMSLQRQPFEVLAMLLEQPGTLVSREQLRERLWPGDVFVDTDHGVNKAINKLRTALDDTGAQPRFIETLARRGYRFIAPVTSVTDASGDGRSASRILCEGRTISLAFGTHIIGRDETAAISTDSQTVSRRHARLLLTPDAAVLEDLGSKNGTRVNGAIVRGATPLSDGDQIQIGALQLVFRTWAYGSTKTAGDASKRARHPDQS